MKPDLPRSTPQQEAAWIHRIAEGDRQAFEELFRVYVRRLASYVNRMIDDWEAAQELTNDIMVTIWKEAKRFQGRSKPSTWIFGIARYKALSELRRRKRHPSAELDEVSRLPDPGQDPERAAIRLDQQADLKRALQKLSPDHREVIQLVFFQCMSYREIAQVLDCPLNTVKTRMFHAKKKLRPILKRMALGGEGS